VTEYASDGNQYRVTKPNLSDLKRQLARMKEDLSHFVSRKPGGVVVEPLRKRISELEAEIAGLQRD
jgi:hypothetical protein